MSWTRRELLAAAGGFAAAACRSFADPDTRNAARVTARPRMPTKTVQAGERRLGAASARGALLYVPQRAATATPVPLLVMLHGAGGNAEGMRFTFPYAERIGAVVLAPESRAQTWDVILGSFGPDVEFISGVMEETFETVAANPARIAIGGFSDGASYALTLGLANGSLFTHVIAFSPGFNAAPERDGSPRIFVSHGTADTVLPIDVTSRRIVPELRRQQYDVTYQEFDGPHAVPPAIAQQAFDWFA